MDNFDYRLFAEIAGKSIGQACRDRQDILAGEYKKHLWPSFQAIYKLTGKTPNDLIPYKEEKKP